MLDENHEFAEALQNLLEFAATRIFAFSMTCHDFSTSATFLCRNPDANIAKLNE